MGCTQSQYGLLIKHVKVCNLYVLVQSLHSIADIVLIHFSSSEGDCKSDFIDFGVIIPSAS